MDWDGIKRFYLDALPILLLGLTGSFFAGVVLGGKGMRQVIQTIPGILLIIPAFLATRGNVYGALGARIATALHQGLIEPLFQYDRRLRNAVVAAVINAMTASLFISVAGWSLLWLLGLETGSLLTLTLILLVSGLFSSLVMTAVLITGLFIGYRYSIDPDILNGPLITSLGDLFGMALLFLSVKIVLVIL